MISWSRHGLQKKTNWLSAPVRAYLPSSGEKYSRHLQHLKMVPTPEPQRWCKCAGGPAIVGYTYRRVGFVSEVLFMLKVLAAKVVGVSAVMPGKASNGGSWTLVSGLVLGSLVCPWRGLLAGLVVSSDEGSFLRFIFGMLLSRTWQYHIWWKFQTLERKQVQKLTTQIE
jgi:hypothetical protein